MNLGKTWPKVVDFLALCGQLAKAILKTLRVVVPKADAKGEVHTLQKSQLTLSDCTWSLLFFILLF